MTIPRMAIALLGAVGLNAAMILWTVVERYAGDEPPPSDSPNVEVQSAADVPPSLPLPLPTTLPQFPEAHPNLSLDALRQLDPQFLQMATEVYPELSQPAEAAVDTKTQAVDAAQLVRLEQRLATVHNLTSAALGLAREAQQSPVDHAELVHRRQQMIAQLRSMAAELLQE